jgi:hypothetical protein
VLETVTIERCAEILGCSRRRVFQLLADGTLERAPRYGRGIRVLGASVERALGPTASKPGRRKRRPVGDVPALIRPEDTRL